MRSLILLTLLACEKKSNTDTAMAEQDTDAKENLEEQADTATEEQDTDPENNNDSDNTDTPTDEDEDDTDSESDEGDEDCELLLRAESRDQNGPCTECTSGHYITLVGVVKNPCSGPLIYTSEKDCLISEFTVTNTAFSSSSIYPITCPSGLLRETLEPGERIDSTRPAGRLSEGNFELVVQFEDAPRTVRSLNFKVQ